MNVLRRMNETVDAVRKVLPVTTDKIATSLYYELRTTLSKVEIWQEHGAKTFILHPSLIDAFQNTDIPMDAFPADFQYPFESFMIESDKPLFFTGNTTPVHNILYVSKKAVDTATGKAITTINPDFTIAGEIQWGRTITAFFNSNTAMGKDFVDCIFIYMTDMETIRDNLKIKKSVKPGHIALTDLENCDSRHMMNIFYNTVLYVNDPHRDRAETETHGTRKMKTGTDIGTISTSYINLFAPKNYKPLSEGNGTTLDKRFIVRGHWRNQACGEKRREHKRIWIHPYYKGPELAEIINKPYLVR
jgi:hypothetical protein